MLPRFVSHYEFRTMTKDQIKSLIKADKASEPEETTESN